ncbi:MAG: hypothetical protein KC636_16510 [Myxococcales bacterium]|nr:hypothetical protein [Myxococcales bacterium]
MRAKTAITTLTIGLGFGLFVEACGPSASSVCDRTCAKSQECGEPYEGCEQECLQAADILEDVGSCRGAYLDLLDCVADLPCGDEGDGLLRCQEEAGISIALGFDDEGSVPACGLDGAPSVCEDSCAAQIACGQATFDTMDQCVYFCVLGRAYLRVEAGDDCLDAYDDYIGCSGGASCGDASACLSEATAYQTKCPLDGYETTTTY